QGLVEVDRVLVVDDGSTDDTAATARAAGADVLRLTANRGKGGAVTAAVEAAPDADTYFLIDADVGASAARAAALLEPVRAGTTGTPAGRGRGSGTGPARASTS